MDGNNKGLKYENLDTGVKKKDMTGKIIHMSFWVSMWKAGK